MTKRAAILQSNYIPWKGYFDIINAVDEFVIYDDMQYTIRDWRTRNKIKTSQGAQWLSVPVKVESRSQIIRDTKIATDVVWRGKHAKTFTFSYTRSRYFKEFWPIFEALYQDESEVYLSKVNFAFIRAINEILGIKTRLTWSHEYELVGDRSEKLANICQQLGADEYVTGPSALDYMEQEVFRRYAIRVKVTDYRDYPEYTQLYPPFEHAVSVLDLIFNEGLEARKYMKTFPESLSAQPFLKDAWS